MKYLTFGAFLKHRREILGYTQKQVADKIGISEKQYSLYEINKVNFRRVSALHITKLCIALKISLSEFYKIQNQI